MSAVAIYDAPLSDQITYAKALASSGMLPKQYQGKPDNLLWAIGYAQMLGCHPLTAVTGVHVIEGKPSASAALISALVRRAGHKLRISGDSQSATAIIIRHDDPDFPFEVTFTLEDAETAGLLSKDVWKQYPASMLKARAVTQCARDACEEALSGLLYTAEELGAEVDGEDGLPVIDGVVVPKPQAFFADDKKAERGVPAEDLWAAHPAAKIPATDDAWLTDWMGRLGVASSKTDLAELWRELSSQVKAGDCTPADAADLEVQWQLAKGGLLDLLGEAAAEPHETHPSEVDPDVTHPDQLPLPSEAGVA